RVMALRFGIGIHQEYTLREVASQIGVSPERVRQIEREALAKLQDIAGENLQTLLGEQSTRYDMTSDGGARCWPGRHRDVSAAAAIPHSVMHPHLRIVLWRT